MQQQRFQEPFGKIRSLDGYPSEERALCGICRRRKHTTVNHVCLDCLQKKSKYVPR